MSTPILFAICTAIWGTTWIAITFQLADGVDAAASVTYRFALAASILFAWAKRRGVWRHFTLREHAFLAALGATYATNYLAIYHAERTLPSGLVAVLGATILFFNIVLARVVLGTRLTRPIAWGAGMGALGVVVVFSDDVLALLRGEIGRDLVAVGLALLGSFAASAANIAMQRNANRNWAPLATNAGWTAYCALFCGLYVVVSDVSFGFALTPGYVLSLLYLAVFGSVLAFSAYLVLMLRVGPSRAGYIAVATPVVALTLSTLLEGLAWSGAIAIGLVLIAVGQVVIVRSR